MLKNLVFVFLILVISNTNSFPQNTPDNYQADTAYVNRLIDKCTDLLFYYPDSASLFVDTILKVSAQINYEYGLYKAHNLSGYIHGIVGNQNEALNSYKKALIHTYSSEYPRRKAVVLSNIGLTYWRMIISDSAEYYLDSAVNFSNNNNVPDIKRKTLFDLANLYLDQDKYVEAAEKLFQARDSFILNDDSIPLVFAYGSLGVLYTKVNNFELALKNYELAIETDMHVDEIDNRANNYINIGELYFRSIQQYDSALNYYRKSIISALPHMRNHYENAANINIGNVYLEKKMYDSAYYYYNRVYYDTLTKYYPDRHAAVLINLGEYYKNNQNFSKSREFLIAGLILADSFNLLNFKATGLKALYEIDSIEANYFQSIKNLIEYHRINDSLEVASDKHKIAALEFDKFIAMQKYDNDFLRRENELNNKLIANQKILLWVSFIALIILLSVLFVLYRNRKKIKVLYNRIAEKKDALADANEELTVTNETLNSQKLQLKELNLAKDKFFSILGHDLKSPFNSLLGMLQLMDEDWNLINDDEKKGHIHNLYLSSKKTYELLEDLLLWGRAQRGLLEYKPEKFNIYDNVIPILDLFQSQLNQKKQSVTIDISKELVIKTDPRYFIQILQNLVNNAIKFTPIGGMITITAIEYDKKISVCIVDTGIGIPEDKIPTIFNIDDDFNRPGTENEKSTGMGLILCKEYASLIGAKLSVSSIEQNIEQGIVGTSSFCLSLRK